MVDVANCTNVQVRLLPLELATGRTDDEAAAAREDLEGGVWLRGERGRRGEGERGRGGDGKRGFGRRAVLGGVGGEKSLRQRGDGGHCRAKKESRGEASS
jgi:hypothetical protein